MILTPLQRLARLQASNPSLSTRVRQCWELEQCTSPMRCLYSAELTPENLLPCELEVDLWPHLINCAGAGVASCGSEAECSPGTPPSGATPMSVANANYGESFSVRQREAQWSSLQQATALSRIRSAATALQLQQETYGTPGQGMLSRMGRYLKLGWRRVRGWFT